MVGDHDWKVFKRTVYAQDSVCQTCKIVRTVWAEFDGPAEITYKRGSKYIRNDPGCEALPEQDLLERCWCVVS